MNNQTITLPTLTCLRCGYSWHPRSNKLPETCASLKCKSRYWNRPRRTKKENALTQMLSNDKNHSVKETNHNHRSKLTVRRR